MYKLPAVQRDRTCIRLFGTGWRTESVVVAIPGTSRQKLDSGSAVSATSTGAFLLSKAAGSVNAGAASSAQTNRRVRFMTSAPPNCCLSAELTIRTPTCFEFVQESRAVPERFDDADITGLERSTTEGRRTMRAHLCTVGLYVRFHGQIQ